MLIERNNLNKLIVWITCLNKLITSNHFISFLNYINIVQSNNLKVQSCKLYYNKFMFALTQIRNSEMFVFIAVLVFKLLSRKILFINRKDNRNC